MNNLLGRFGWFGTVDGINVMDSVGTIVFILLFLNFRFETLNFEPETPNPKPQTPNHSFLSILCSIF